MNNACQTKGQGKCDSGQMYNTTLRQFSTFGNDKVGMNEKEGGFFFSAGRQTISSDFFICSANIFNGTTTHKFVCVYVCIYKLLIY